MRALPVEFVDVLESVPNVHLHGNPWSDLPPRWGKLWPGTHATDGAGGYSLSDAVDFLYGMRAFYDTAEQIWEELGVFHYAQKLSLDDFVQEIRVRIPKTWHDGLVEYVKHVYFTVSVNFFIYIFCIPILSHICIIYMYFFTAVCSNVITSS